jgi:thioesterase domain-containing protein/acyl carrier protein
MVPSLFFILDELPLTSNGKVDANALLAFDRLAARSSKDFVAPTDKLQEQLIVIWESLLDARPIGVRDDFFELGGHSLIAVQLIARIEKDLGKRLPMASLFEGATIERLSELLREGPGASSVGSSLLAPIQPNGSQSPLFCVHAAGGTVFCYTALARHLGQDQPLYGIQAEPESDGAIQTIEAMASKYVGSVRAFQPAGPYFLGGWSMGGVIAFEMARQLVQQNQKVGLLFLVDVQAPSGEAAEYKWVVLLGSFAVDLGLPFDQLQTSWDEIFSRPPMEQLRKIWSEAKKAKLVHPEMTLADFRKLFDRFKANAQTTKNYEGGDYAGRITFFRADEPEKYVGKARPEKYTIPDEPTRGWEKWAGGNVEVHTIPGQHYTVMREPFVGGLAEQLRICLQKAIKES